MSVLVYRDSDTLSQAVATLLTGCIIEKPASALGLDCSQRLAAVYRKIAGMTSDACSTGRPSARSTSTNTSRRIRKRPRFPACMPCCTTV
jgi:hypothetical protein